MYRYKINYNTLFQFTHPVWGATSVNVDGETIFKFQFTHPVWGATDGASDLGSKSFVSIHAPRVGCDTH